MKKKIHKNFFVSWKCASELDVLKCLYQEENSCHGQSVC